MIDAIVQYISWGFFAMSFYFGTKSLFNRSEVARRANAFGFYKGSFKATFTPRGWKYQKYTMWLLTFAIVVPIVYQLIESWL